ncbi:MAG: 30S ribosomal protein S13 [Chloroflexi bacterium]|nr:30S ribosomal protein S13 [Chloroflexota bacterium]
MARVAGVDIPDNKRAEVALCRIYGVGPTLALRVLQRAGVEGNPRVKELSETQLARIREVVESSYKVEGDLRRETTSNVRRLIDIGTYRGLRHRRGLPVRGQRTKTNARTKRGARRTVAGRRRASAKK